MYHKIMADFGFDEAKDVESAEYLARVIGGRGAENLEGLKGKFPRSVMICGGSSTLADEISSERLEGFVVAADSATSVLLEADILPDMIVTDLDGLVEDQIDANSRGSAVIVHAHGDNMRMLDSYVSKFPGRLVGTCQCPPVPGLFNFGGFTDGDRAACICAELGARDLALVGFDFYRPSEKTGKSRSVKARKLLWAKVVLEQLVSQGVRVTTISSRKR
jgi:hypothetical protein